MIIRRFDFLWFVLTGWVIFWLTLQTNGWYFLLGNNNRYGVLVASILAIILAVVGLSRSVNKFSNQTKRREILIVHIITWILALILIGLLVLWIGISQFKFY